MRPAQIHDTNLPRPLRKTYQPHTQRKARTFTPPQFTLLRSLSPLLDITKFSSCQKSTTHTYRLSSIHLARIEAIIPISNLHRLSQFTIHPHARSLRKLPFLLCYRLPHPATCCLCKSDVILSHIETVHFDVNTTQSQSQYPKGFGRVNE